MSEEKSNSQLIMPLIAAAIIAAITYLFSSISDLKHSTDTTNITVEHHTDQLQNLWKKRDEDMDFRMEITKDLGNFRVNYYKDKCEDE